MRALAPFALLALVCFPAPLAATPTDDAALHFRLGHPVGFDGRGAIEDFRGQPVLFAWYKDGAYAMDAAVKAMKLHKKHAKKGLVVVVIDSEASGADGWAKSHAFLVSRFGGFEAWSSGGVAVPGANSSYADGAGVALVGADGTMVLKGANRTLGNKLDKAIVGELKRMRAGWGDDAVAKEMRALAFGKGKLGAAAALHVDGNAAAATAMKDIEARYHGLKKRVEFASADGCFAEAERALATLADAVAGHAPWVEAVQALEKSIAARATDDDRAREKTLQKFHKAIARGKVSRGQLKKIEAFATSCAGHAQAGAAKRCATLAAAVAAR